MPLPDLLARFEAAFAAAAPPRAARLQPGLPSADVERALQALGFHAPEYVALHAWRDGLAAMPPMEMWTDALLGDDAYVEQVPLDSLDGWYAPLASALSDVAMFAELRATFAARGEPCHFRPEFLPVLQYGAYGYLVLDTKATLGGVPGQLLSFDYKSSGDFIFQYESVTAWMATCVALLDAGLYFEPSHDDEVMSLEARLNGAFRAAHPPVPLR